MYTDTYNAIYTAKLLITTLYKVVAKGAEVFCNAADKAKGNVKEMNQLLSFWSYRGIELEV